ncbi:hypothetical protein J2TS6_59750 [Paenibacillus albilobatus]|uniref:Uncharacterized protein n=1 Tax=Paenibacillus albilobatus TaxID=2716884 RepID=A0A919XLA4_9BACL|nr:hypothetical protein J2TS6_59750 [Paenibacillus albilobatus]
MLGHPGGSERRNRYKRIIDEPELFGATWHALLLKYLEEKQHCPGGENLEGLDRRR